MIILIGWNMHSTLCSNTIKQVKLNQHCHFPKSFLQRYLVNCCPTLIKQLLWTSNSFSSAQFKCFTTMQNFHWASQLSRLHKTMLESNEECLVKRISSLAFQIHIKGKSRVTMQGRLCYVTILNYCIVTACWPSLNYYLQSCTSTYIQETNQ